MAHLYDRDLRGHDLPDEVPRARKLDLEHDCAGFECQLPERLGTRADTCKKLSVDVRVVDEASRLVID
jgi:hypothetical protein